MQRRSLLMALGLSVASPPGVVRAQPTFPDRPVCIVVPFPPGGSYDVVARLLSRPLQEAWPRGVVIDNRPGACGNIPACLPFLLDGKLTGLGISSADRFQTFPAVPAIAETVPGFAMDSWYGVLVPASTDPALRAQIAGVALAALSQPATATALRAQGYEPDPMEPAPFTSLLERDAARNWSPCPAPGWIRPA